MVYIIFHAKWTTSVVAYVRTNLTTISICNNRIVKMCGHARGLRGRTGGRRRAQTGIEGSGCGGQAKIAMSRQRRGLRGRTDGRASTGNPAAKWRDGLLYLQLEGTQTHVFTTTCRPPESMRVCVLTVSGSL